MVNARFGLPRPLEGISCSAAKKNSPRIPPAIPQAANPIRGSSTLRLAGIEGLLRKARLLKVPRLDLESMMPQALVNRVPITRPQAAPMRISIDFSQAGSSMGGLLSVVLVTRASIPWKANASCTDRPSACPSTKL